MKTVAVTAGMGRWFPEFAKKLADRVNHLASYVDDGIECIDASSKLPWQDIRNHRMAGGWVWDAVPDDVERVVWIDCDAIPIRPLRLSELPEGRFCAVSDVGLSVEIAKEQWPPLRPVTSYFNSGVYFATRETQPIFEQYKCMGMESDPQERRFPDQDLLNYLIWKNRSESTDDPAGWVSIPYEWNALLWSYMPPRPRIIHFAGIQNRRDQMEMMYNVLAENERWLLELSK